MFVRMLWEFCYSVRSYYKATWTDWKRSQVEVSLTAMGHRRGLGGPRGLGKGGMRLLYKVQCLIDTYNTSCRIFAIQYVMNRITMTSRIIIRIIMIVVFLLRLHILTVMVIFSSMVINTMMMIRVCLRLLLFVVLLFIYVHICMYNIHICIHHKYIYIYIAYYITT